MVCLTTDLWSNRAKQGYIGITATWITPNFKVKDVMLEIQYAPSSILQMLLLNYFMIVFQIGILMNV